MGENNVVVPLLFIVAVASGIFTILASRWQAQRKRLEQVCAHPPVPRVDTERLRGLLRMASSLPWRQGDGRDEATWVVVRDRERPDPALGKVELLASCSTSMRSEGDAALIAQAVTAMPAMLDEIDWMRAELQAVRAIAKG